MRWNYLFLCPLTYVVLAGINDGEQLLFTQKLNGAILGTKRMGKSSSQREREGEKEYDMSVCIEFYFYIKTSTREIKRRLKKIRKAQKKEAIKTRSGYIVGSQLARHL